MTTPEPVQDSPGTSTSWSHRVGLCFFGVGVVVVLLAIVEGALAFLGVAEIERFTDPYVGFEEGATLFTVEPGDGGERYVTRPGKLEFFNPQEFPVHKAPGTYRVFTLGGSTTAGRPYDDQVSFSRWLELYLDGAEPSKRHEVINGGAISYASYRIVVLMKELVRYEPDLFVVLTGHNEFLEERTYRDLVEEPGALNWLRPKLSRLRLSHWVWETVGARRETEDVEKLPDEVQTRLDVWTGLAAYERDDDLRRSVIEHFEFNLQQMVDLARTHDVDLVWVQPASNLKDFSPFKSQHRPSLETTERQRFLDLLGQGRRLLAADATAAALDALREAKAIDSEYAELHYRLGQAYLQQQAFDEAHAAFVRAKDLDVAPLRSIEPLLERVRTVAARESVRLIDLPTLLEDENERRLGHRILGNEIFLDHVHPDIDTHRLIAQQVLDALADDGKVDIDPAWSPVAKQSIDDQVMATLDADYYARRDLNLAKVLGWAGKLEEAELPLRRAAEVLRGEPDLHLNLGILLQKTGRAAAAVEHLERATELNPVSSEAHFNLGVSYGRLQRFPEAIAAVERAIQLREEYPEAHYNLSLLQRHVGQGEAAIAAARRALELNPAAESYAVLAQAYRAEGRFDEARRAFEASLRLDPEAATVRMEWGITLAEEGRFDEAVAELRRAAILAPEDPEVHYNLGYTLAQLQRDEAAMTSYLRVLELAPDHLQGNNNLGLLYARRGDLENALRYLTHATDVDPAYADAWLNLGVVYDMSGQPGEAIRVMSRALELRPDDAKTHYALGMLYLATGRRSRAIPHFEAARRGGMTLPAAVVERLGT